MCAQNRPHAARRRPRTAPVVAPGACAGVPQSGSPTPTRAGSRPPATPVGRDPRGLRASTRGQVRPGVRNRREATRKRMREAASESLGGPSGDNTGPIRRLVSRLASRGDTHRVMTVRGRPPEPLRGRSREPSGHPPDARREGCEHPSRKHGPRPCGRSSPRRATSAQDAAPKSLLLSPTCHRTGLASAAETSGDGACAVLPHRSEVAPGNPRGGSDPTSRPALRPCEALPSSLSHALRAEAREGPGKPGPTREPTPPRRSRRRSRRGRPKAAWGPPADRCPTAPAAGTSASRAGLSGPQDALTGFFKLKLTR